MIQPVFFDQCLQIWVHNVEFVAFRCGEHRAGRGLPVQPWEPTRRCRWTGWSQRARMWPWTWWSWSSRTSTSAGATCGRSGTALWVASYISSKSLPLVLVSEPLGWGSLTTWLAMHPCPIKASKGCVLHSYGSVGVLCNKNGRSICDPASQNQQKVAWPSFVLWLEIGDQGQHG